MRQVLVAGEVALATCSSRGRSPASAQHDSAPTRKPRHHYKQCHGDGSSAPQEDFYGPPERRRFCQDVREAATSIPGVTAASAVSTYLHRIRGSRSFVIAGQAPPSQQRTVHVDRIVSCPGYFGALGIPILQVATSQIPTRLTPSRW
jgi:hypothetical protein